MKKIIITCIIFLIILTSCSNNNEEIYSEMSKIEIEFTESEDATLNDEDIVPKDTIQSIVTTSINQFSENIIVNNTTLLPNITVESSISSSFDNISEEIMMVSIYESFAFSYQQEIEIVDVNGNCYTMQNTDISESFNFADNNWYDVLKSMLQTESNGKLNDCILDSIRDFASRFQDYTEYSLKQYPGATMDYGVKYLYGIYHDENNVTQYILLCSFGDDVNCIDDSDVTELINKLSSTPFFYTMGFEY